MMDDTNKEVADLLRELARAKKLVKSIRADMVKIAVEKFGMNQHDAVSNSGTIDVFLDGCLVGQGVIQKWREED